MIGFTRQNQVEELRYEGLRDVVESYLGDEDGDSADLISDLKRACAEIREYHDERSKHLTAVEEAFK